MYHIGREMMCSLNKRVINEKYITISAVMYCLSSRCLIVYVNGVDTLDT